MPSRKSKRRSRGDSQGADSDELVRPKTVTGKELSALDELSARLTALVELLDEKGIVNKNEYSRIVAMRLHAISKARAFEELHEEL